MSDAPLENMPVIEGVRVDIDSLLSISHHCDPACCKNKNECCKFFEIEVTTPEANRAVGMLANAATYAPTLYENGAPLDPIEETEGGHCLAAHEDGACVFLFRNDNGEIRCSLHAAALELDFPPEKAKPDCCSLWPLALIEELDPPLLTLQENVRDFACNRFRRRKTLDHGIADIIQLMFKSDFLERLQAHIGLRTPQRNTRLDSHP